MTPFVQRSYSKVDYEQKRTGEPLMVVEYRLGNLPLDYDAVLVKNTLEVEFGVSYVALADLNVPAQVLALVPQAFILDRKIVPIDYQTNFLRIAMVDPNDRKSVSELKELLPQCERINLSVCSRLDFEHFALRCGWISHEQDSEKHGDEITATKLEALADSDDPGKLKNVPFSLMSCGETRQAIESFKKAALLLPESDPLQSYMRYLIVCCHFGQSPISEDDYLASLLLYDQAIAQSTLEAIQCPDDYSKQEVAGFILLSSDVPNLNEALKFLERAATLKPDRSPYLSYEIACHLYRSAAVDGSISVGPHPLPANKEATGFDLMERHLNNATKGPLNVREAAYGVLGRIYYSANRPEFAIKYFRLGRRLDFRCEHAWCWELANAYYATGQLLEALNELVIAHKFGQEDEFTHRLLAAIYKQRGEAENAGKHEKLAEAIEEKKFKLEERNKFCSAIGPAIARLPAEQYEVIQRIIGHAMFVVPENSTQSSYHFSPCRKNLEEIAKELGKTLEQVKQIRQQAIESLASRGLNIPMCQ